MIRDFQLQLQEGFWPDLDLTDLVPQGPPEESIQGVRGFDPLRQPERQG